MDGAASNHAHMNKERARRWVYGQLRGLLHVLFVLAITAALFYVGGRWGGLSAEFAGSTYTPPEAHSIGAAHP